MKYYEFDGEHTFMFEGAEVDKIFDGCDELHPHIKADVDKWGGTSSEMNSVHFLNSANAALFKLKYGTKSTWAKGEKADLLARLSADPIESRHWR